MDIVGESISYSLAVGKCKSGDEGRCESNPVNDKRDDTYFEKGLYKGIIVSCMGFEFGYRKNRDKLTWNGRNGKGPKNVKEIATSPAPMLK